MSRNTPTAQSQFLHVPIEWAFEAFTKQEHLARWLCDDAFVLPQRDGAYELRFHSGDVAEAVVGRITRWEPPQHLAIAWPGGQAVSLSLAPGLGGTLAALEISQAGTGSGRAAGKERLTELWSSALPALASYFGSLDR